MSCRPLIAFLSLGWLLACPGNGGNDASQATLIVGIQSEGLRGLAEAVHVVTTVGDQPSSDETFPIGSANPGGLPKEITVAGAAGARVEILVEALTTQAQGKGAPPTPVVTRRASATLVQGTKKLLRIQLEDRCVTFVAPGELALPAPACNAPETCIGGRCVGEEVSFDQLEDYEPSWPTSPPDFCRPANHGPPELALGTGQTDYAPLTDGQTLPLERGPQGGHHLWIAVRMKNLRRSGSTTTLSAKLVDDPSSPILPAAFVFSFERDEGNYCKLWGLRYQLDAGASDLGADYKRFLGKRLAVTVEVVDGAGGRASAAKTLLIADKLLCPDGTTTSCNP